MALLALSEVHVMAFKLVIAAAFLTVAMLCYAAPAAAEFTVCNSSTYGKANVAYAITWQDSQGKAYGESQGWWIVAQDACQIIVTNDISAYTVYIYAFADSDPVHDWWGGSNNFCLNPSDKFLYHGDDMDTPCSTGQAYGMRFIDTGGNSTYTYYLRD